MKISHPHFSIVKGKTHYFHLSVVVAVALFVAAMSAIAVITLTTDLAALQDLGFAGQVSAQTPDVFSVGNRIKNVNPSGASVYADPTTSGRFLNPQYGTGSILAGPKANEGDMWWWVDFDINNDGRQRSDHSPAILVTRPDHLS